MEKLIETIDNREYGGYLFDSTTYKLDFKKQEDRDILPSLLDEMIKLKDSEDYAIDIEINNVISDDFYEEYIKPSGVDDVYEDTNGWELDWFNHMFWKDVRVEVSGCAWYGTIQLYLDDE